jgi:hypothetical protein
MRAYKATIALHKGQHDDWVEKKDFKTLIGNLFYFNKLYWIFDQADGDDRRITIKEFQWCLTMCGVTMTDAEAQREFKKMDRNGGGIILFDEFCIYFTGKNCPAAMSALVDGPSTPGAATDGLSTVRACGNLGYPGNMQGNMAQVGVVRG